MAQDPVAEAGLELGVISIEIRSPALKETAPLLLLQTVAVPEMEQDRDVSAEFFRKVNV
jgi:hypothetical protein